MNGVAILCAVLLSFVNVHGSSIRGSETIFAHFFEISLEKKEIPIIRLVKSPKFRSRAGELKEECNYLGVGDETVQSAAPVTKFYTSGYNFGPDWCIAKCKHGHSIKAAINFHLNNGSAPVFTVKSYRSLEGKRVFSAIKADGQNDSDDYDSLCMDDEVRAVADAVFETYKEVETIAKALNYYINKPGWAYLVYELGEPPSIVYASNILQDPNVCMRSYWMLSNGQFAQFQLLAGKVE